MDGNRSFALDLEIQLADTNVVLEHWFAYGELRVPNHDITDVVYNICWLKLDQGIMKIYDRIASDETDKSVISCSTYIQQSSITSKNNYRNYIY